MNSENKTCQNCKNTFTITLDDLAFYEKMKVPPPTLCMPCRAIRRMIWWNEHYLYRKKDIHGREIFSTYPEASPIKIMERDEWWGDSWDGLEYGREYDEKKPFFEQFQALLKEVPWPARDVQRCVNSDYSNQAADLKNSYLCFNHGKGEECLYGVASKEMRDSVDYYFSGSSELCYEVANADKCYQTFFSIDVEDCRNVWFSRDCVNCSDCFGCTNLRSKQFHIFNEPYTKEEYAKKIEEMNLGSYQGMHKAREKAIGFWRNQPYRFVHTLRTTNNIGGDYVYNTKNARYCFQVLDGENLAYCQNMSCNIKDSMDYTNWGNNAELIYESINVGENARNLKFCFNCWPGSHDLEYCVNVMSSSDCFGCVGLKKKQYCILNKQYSPSEYAELISKIKSQMSSAAGGGEYGEFFPIELSPLAFNESVAFDYFPDDKKNYPWREPEEREYKITMPNSQIPDHISDVRPTIAKEVIECYKCGKAYRILERELEFYKRFKIPLPRHCHKCRFNERKKFINPMRWWKRSCDKCLAVVESTFSPERPEIIYCESCYQQEFM